MKYKKIVENIVSDQWQKVAMIVGRVAKQEQHDSISDETINNVITCLKALIDSGAIEHRGNISEIRNSEVRKAP